MIGTAFTSRLTDRLAAILPAQGTEATPSATGLTPAIARSLPADTADAVVNAYASALTPVFGWLVPMFIAFLPEVPLATTTPLSEIEAEARAQHENEVTTATSDSRETPASPPS